MSLRTFIENLKNTRASKAKSDTERYFALIRKGAVGDLTSDDRKALALLVEILKKTPEEVAADEAVITEYNACIELAKHADARRAASKAAGRARDDFATDVEKKNKEFAIRQQELIAAVGPAQQAASEAMAARERGAALTKSHWQLLDQPQPAEVPAPTPPQMNVPRPPSPPASEDQIAEELKRREARQRALVAPAAASIDQFRAVVAAHNRDIQTGYGPQKKDAENAENVDPVAKIAWLEAQGRGPASKAWNPLKKTKPAAV
jgi:hypothetical protein